MNKSKSEIQEENNNIVSELNIPKNSIFYMYGGIAIIIAAISFYLLYNNLYQMTFWIIVFTIITLWLSIKHSDPLNDQKISLHIKNHILKLENIKLYKNIFSLKPIKIDKISFDSIIDIHILNYKYNRKGCSVLTKYGYFIINDNFYNYDAVQEYLVKNFKKEDLKSGIRHPYLLFWIFIIIFMILTGILCSIGSQKGWF